ncbi:MAG TPA: PQQ-dependent dehydrogenase, methanol/ethanol family [Myxococcota bacterium]|nr:PQQ-dependent dehydrogenase, methanol/ethanol family [Myxococcota bacterium]
MKHALALGLALAFSWGSAAAAEKEEQPAEIQLPPVPTHWKAENPVGTTAKPVTAEMLNGQVAPTDHWIQYGGNYRNFRHTPLKNLTPESVKKLSVAWAFPTGTTGQFEASPVIYGGVMYVTSSYNRLFALDAKTGALLWRYDHKNGENLRLCCGPPNRGVGILGDSVLMGTLDAHLIAFDRKTGEILWNTEVGDYKQGYSLTSAPLMVHDMAIIGVAGGEYGVRGYFDAYDVKTGKRVWRKYTVPGKGEPGADSWAGDSYARGGSPAWTYGAYDPETDTLFWTTGNPAPDWDGDGRAGDNLYSDSVLALDPKTGDVKWYFQFTPHDVWDYDGNTQLFLVDAKYDGKPRKLLVQANRNGFFYVLDRSDGKFLRATPYLEQVNWATIDAKGRPQVNPQAMPLPDSKFRTCPSNLGGMNGSFTGAYNPDLGLAFIPSAEACQVFTKGISAFKEGLPYLGGLPDTVDATAGKAYGNMAAIDVATGKVKWRYRDNRPMMGGTLSTAGGVVFSGNLEGEVLAFDAKTGKVVWRFRSGGGMRSQPVAYELDGRTYVAVPTGSFSTMDSFAAGVTKVPEGGTLFVFALPK